MERDKYLTEAMGLCWHEWIQDHVDNPQLGQCKKCDVWDGRISEDGEKNPDFSTWQGFGQLSKFILEYGLRIELDSGWVLLLEESDSIISEDTYKNHDEIPDKIATLFYKFLKERRKP